MTLLPLDLQPGILKNGTAYSGRGRWADSNLVRWKDNGISVVGGWQRRTAGTASLPIPALFSDPTQEAPRNMISWTALDGTRHLVIGTNLSLFHVSASGVVSDITPTGFTGGAKDASVRAGYGTGVYGAEAYSAPRTSEGLLAVPVASWSLDLWGEDLIAQFRGVGPVYKWTPNVDPVALPIATAPEDMQAIVVTDERILFGIDGPERMAQWSTTEDRTQWSPLPTNQAGSQRIAGSGKLVTIAKVVNTLLILGEEDAHVARYQGPPFIYGFERVSASCGVVSANAVVVADKFAMWPCGRNMWRFDGAQVTQVQSDVTDFFRRDLNRSERTKIYGFQIRDFNEIWWLYPSTNNSEPDSYICYDYAQDHWTRGKIDRTVGGDRSSALANVLMVSPSGLLYNHELAGVAVTSGPIPYCEIAPVEIAAGEQQAFVDFIYPDVRAGSNMTATLKARDMPQAVERSYGPYELKSPTPVRVRGRQVSVRFESRDVGWTIGSMRLNVKAGGKK